MRNCLRIFSQPSVGHAIRQSSTAPLAVMNNVIQEVMDSIHEAGTFKPERVITTRQAAGIKVQGSDRKILNFCANNYLGLSVC